jgi:hypothetical protein
VFACQFTQRPMAGKTVVPTDITLFGPVGQPCTDNYGDYGSISCGSEVSGDRGFLGEAPL